MKPNNPIPIAKRRAVDYWLKLNYLGLVFGLVFFSISLFPSLMPRPWLYQGLISGISVAIGYGVGVLSSTGLRWLLQREISTTNKRRAWKTFYYVAGPLIIGMLVWGANLQNEVRRLVGEQPVQGYHMIRILLLTVVISLALITIGRAIRMLNAIVRKWAQKWLPPRLSAVISLGLVGLVLYWLVSGVLAQSFIQFSNNAYRSQNDKTESGVKQPISPTRSGSSESLIAWQTLGRQGQSFVSSGPSQEQLRSFEPSGTKEQIRIYSGLKSADTPSKRADLAVNELERTRAFERKVLVVATPTGTGWLEPQSVDSLEYMYGGNSAIVAQQYSYLPSWISFLVDKQNAQEAGQSLYNAVYAKWSKLPVETRPKLIVYGLSLGSFGSQSAFTGINDLQYSADGALFIGTPNDTQLWRTVTKNRDKGSPEWQPIYDNGQIVRFGATNEDIQRNQSTWTYPRILYMQHASDPVVWFSFDLLLNKPGWLSEKRGPDVSSRTNWYPFVTFAQVAVDQFFGVSVPNGHGHNYGNTVVEAWRSIANPEHWTQTKTDQLQSIINSYEVE